MRITRRLATAAVAGTLAVGGIAALAAPVAAAGTADGTTTRASAIVEALAGLVADGTLTQEQASTVATTLDESDALRGGPGHGGGAHHLDLAAAATALGMTEDELRTALDVDGTTLADVAAAQGVDTAVLVDALVDAATEHVQAEVADGRITQDRADEILAALPERVAAMVEREMRGPGGPRGGRGGDTDPDEDGTSGGTATPEVAPATT